MARSYQFATIALVIVLFFSACEKTEEPSYQIAAESKILMNVAYGKDPKQVMDVYLPPNRTSNTPLLVFIHGGSFIGGDKSDFSQHARVLASNGFGVVNINYRLVNAVGLFDHPTLRTESAVKVKDQVADVSAAVDFAVAQAKGWVVSNNRVGIAGHSAGGTLALLYGYDTRNTKVKAISNIAGALDLVFTGFPNWELLPSYVLEGGFRYTGFEVNAINEKYYKEISPLHKANADRKVPTLNVFPEHNEVMGLPKQDIFTFYDFADRLDQLKVPNELFVVRGADHDFTDETKWALVMQEMLTFFKKNIK